MNSDYYMTVDVDLCTGCETCLDRCQFDALTINDVCEVNLKKCVGCGVCAVTYPEDAMKLVLRDPKEIVEPPENMLEWMTEKAESRQVDPSDLL
ncbi:MAG: 4Fe-4S binding protein [Candidatus Hodarchaeales archaeon]